MAQGFALTLSAAAQHESTNNQLVALGDRNIPAPQPEPDSGALQVLEAAAILPPSAPRATKAWI
eukprot:NODE_14277_length_234_cov_0.743017.p1 GENE.NODE_14277_length_234_cov_0.743017~~NODE_14277_length_234_cov_0.743017.p1  ORF type:complete len:64 (+),score=6.27 NODE_14277_length_234_cov_0.743017:20-211(+)